MPQIIQTYTHAETFAMSDKNLKQPMTELKHIHNDVQTVIHLTRRNLQLPKGSPSHLLATRLQGPINASGIYNLHTLQVHYCLDDLSTLTTIFLKRNPFRDTADPESDAHALINAGLVAFKTLQLAVATFNDGDHELHHVLHTAPEL